MRKITSILMLLLFVFSSGVSAQGIKVSTGADKHWFVIKNFRSGKFAAYGGEENAQDAKKDICQKTLDELTNACYWYAVADGAGYKLYNAAATGKVVDGHAWSETGRTMYVQASSLLSGYYTISTETDPTSTDANNTYGCWDDQVNSTGIGFWKHVKGDEKGTAWLFVDVDAPATLVSKEKVALAVRVAELKLSVGDSWGYWPQSAIDAANATLNTGTTSDDYTQALTTLNNSQKLPDASKYYVITSSYGKYEELQGVTKSIYATESDLKWKTTDLTDKTMYWRILKNADGNWTFQNYGNNKYIGSSAGLNKVFKMGDDAVAGSFVWYPTDCNIKTGDQYFHTGGHSEGKGVEGNVVPYPGGTGSQSAWTLHEFSELEVVKAVLTAAIAKAENSLGVNPGQYPSTAECTSALSEAKEVLNSATATKDDYVAKLTALETALAQAQTQTRNDLKEGYYYRIQNTARQTYTGIEIANQSAGTSQMKNYALDENDPRQIWKLEKDGEKYYLVNVASGLYPQEIAQGSDNTTPVGAKDASKNFTWEIYAEATSTSKAQYNIIVGTVSTWLGTKPGQLNVEENGNVNYWTGDNAHHYLWKVDKTDDEILTLVNNWVKSQNLTASAKVEKLKIAEDATKVISPNEFAAPNVVNDAIDKVGTYVGIEHLTLVQAQDLYVNYVIVKRYEDMANKYDGIKNVEYVLKGQYGTIILPVNYETPDNVKFYTCATADANGVLTLVEATGEKKNQPYIVEYTGEDVPTIDNPKKYQIIGYKKGAETTNQKVGLLTGVLQEGTVYVPSGSYILSKYNGRFAFYRVDGENVKQAQKYRCYLTNPAPTAVSAFYLNGEGETTGINAMLNGNNGETEIYDLSGKRLNHLQKGINIVNGQKVLVK